MFFRRITSKRVVKTYRFFIFCFGIVTLLIYFMKGKSLQFPSKVELDQSMVVEKKLEKNKMFARSFTFKKENVFLNNETFTNKKEEHEDDFSRQFLKGIPDELLGTLSRMYMEVMEWEKGENETITYKENIGACKEGFYRLPTMSFCQKMITCEDVDDRLTYGEFLTTGTAKRIYLGKVDEQVVVISQTNQYRLKTAPRADVGINNLVRLQHPPYVIQLVGHCLGRNNKSVMVTEGCVKYTALRSVIQRKDFFDLSARTRFRMAIQVVASMDYLHRVKENPMMHCDLHGRMQSFSQFLLTDEGQVVLNDLDEIPEVSQDKPIACRPEKGSEMREPDFFPPEGRFYKEDFLIKRRAKPVTEKADIWKIPFLTSVLMVSPRRSLNTEETNILNSLKSIHEQCGEFEPKMRPNSLEVLTAYLNIFKTMYE